MSCKILVLSSNYDMLFMFKRKYVPVKHGFVHFEYFSLSIKLCYSNNLNNIIFNLKVKYTPF